jgi:hypothetical protein
MGRRFHDLVGGHLSFGQPPELSALFHYADLETNDVVSGLLVEAMHYLRFPRAEGDQFIVKAVSLNMA